MQPTTRPQFLLRFSITHSSLVILSLLILVLTSISYAASTTGTVTPANSIIGGNANDRIGSGGVVQLPSGNVLIVSPNWNGGIGAVTCLTPAQYQAGGIVVTAANSLTGSAPTHKVGSGGVTVLSNGNYVVASPNWDGGAVDVGAVTWANGNTCSTNNTTISAANSLVGSTASDVIGNNGVTALTNGHYVVSSLGWDSTGPTVANVGAVTWCNGTTGCIGAVSAANSLIGSSTNDVISFSGVTALTNGHYVVSSSLWNATGPTVANVGAVTWCNGETGCIGAVSAANSLVGSTSDDQIGGSGVTALTNGHYVVNSPVWDTTGSVVVNVGAVTWGNGLGGTVGAVSATNSLVGSTTDDFIGGSGVTALANGRYVVSSSDWDATSPAVSDVGAVTRCSGTVACVGAVSAVNSLVGSSVGDQVGSAGVTALTNGHYVVSSARWDAPSPVVADVGATTWGDGTVGTVGIVSAGNSLVGSSSGDQVGSNGVIALTNGHYVVISSDWDSTSAAVINVGAVTWGNGKGGTVGAINAANSLVGLSINDQVGRYGVTALVNGNYVVSSPRWSGTAANFGAVTWCDGATGCTGAISALNSLVGSSDGDYVGSSGVTALPNGNYVVNSPDWNGVATGLGAVTWGNGLGGTIGVVSVANSLVGSTASDNLGNNNVTALTNGNYVVRSSNWDGAGIDVGAATLGNGLSATVGGISAINSLVGSTALDKVSATAVVPLSGGGYLVVSQDWDNGAMANVGAVTYSDGTFPPPGVTASQMAVNATEGSMTGSYTVRLNAQPSADVLITVTGNAQVAALPLTLTFTPTTWYIPQTITVLAVDDPLVEGAHTSTITHSVSATGGYAGVTVADVTVNLTDDEIAGVNTELLTNGGFETAGATVGIPSGWTITKPSGDKRSCPLVTTNIHGGACAFKFTGSLTDASILTQSVDLTGVTFAAGDTLTASAFFKGNNTAAKLRVTLWVYYTGVATPVKVNLTVRRNAAYTQRSTATYTLTSGAVDQLKLQFSHLSNAGVIWVDDASLIHGVPAILSRDGAALGLPDAPDGFRK